MSKTLKNIEDGIWNFVVTKFSDFLDSAKKGEDVLAWFDIVVNDDKSFYPIIQRCKLPNKISDQIVRKILRDNLIDEKGKEEAEEYIAKHPALVIKPPRNKKCEQLGAIYFYLEPGMPEALGAAIKNYNN